MDKVTYEDLYKFHFISDVKLSADGGQAIFMETVALKEENTYKSRLWLLNVMTGERHLLTQKDGLSTALWLDSKTVLFTLKSKKTEPDSKSPIKDLGGWRTPVYQIHTDGGEARLFMEVPCKASGLTPLGEELFLIQEENQELMENDEDCFVADELPWWANGKGFVNKARRTLYIGRKCLEKCQLTRMTPPFMNVCSAAVSPDKKQIAFCGETYEDMCRHQTQLWFYDIESGESKQVPVSGGELGNLCYMGRERLFFTKYTYEWAGRSPRFMCCDIFREQVEEWPFYDMAVQNSVGSDAKYGGGESVVYDNGVLYYLEANETDTFVAMLDAEGKRSYLNKVPGAVTGIQASDGHFVMTAMREMKLSEVYRVDLLTGREDQLTDFNGDYLKSHRVIAPESFSYLSKNGYTMKGFVLFPADYIPGRKYPVILTMHGGPKVVYGTVFHHEMQCQAGDGYFVIYTNPRGSDGRGEAFADLTGCLGGPDFDDFMEFLDEALSRYPDMDEKHAGICGGSYGGFMCNWMIGHTDRFKAAVSQRSISNYMTKLLCTDIGYYHNKLQIGAYPWEDFDTLWEHSPLKKGMYAKTPTLFLQSDEDYRCYMSDAMQLFSALKRNGCDTRMILFHGENHELSRSGKPHNRVTRLLEMQRWFRKYLL